MRVALALVALAACGQSDRPQGGFAGSIDAYEQYMQKSKASEGALGLRHLVRGVQTYVAEFDRFPPAPAGPTPPVGACCGQPADRCAPATAAPDGTWEVLDLTFDSPFRFSYWYEVIDPEREVVLHAIADLDCDGITSDLSARLTRDGGGVRVQMSESRPDE